MAALLAQPDPLGERGPAVVVEHLRQRAGRVDRVYRRALAAVPTDAIERGIDQDEAHHVGGPHYAATGEDALLVQVVGDASAPPVLVDHQSDHLPDDGRLNLVNLEMHAGRPRPGPMRGWL